MNPQELGKAIMEEYTWRNRLAYKWHQFRMMTSSKYRKQDKIKQDKIFTQDLIDYLNRL